MGEARRAAFVFGTSFVAVATLAAVAMATGMPFLFPSLGPTAFLIFFDPRAPSASPRRVMVGHAIGIVCGWFSLFACGLLDAGPVTVTGVDLPRAAAAALSLSATGALMILLRAVHPPAGATTLIVSLGFLTASRDLAVVEASVAVLVLLSIAIDRVVGTEAERGGGGLPRPPDH